MREYHGFTCWFEKDVHSMPGNPFATETPFGTPVIIGVGNTFEERDMLEAALKEILLHNRDSKIEEIAEAALEGTFRPDEEGLA